MESARSSELIQSKTGYENELKELDKLLELLTNALKENCEKVRFDMYMAFKDELLKSYQSGKASITIGKFNEMISPLVKI